MSRQLRQKNNKISVVLGRKGCGKTTLIKELIKNQDRVIIFDVLDEFEQDAILVTDLDSLPDFIKSNRFKIRFLGEDVEDFDDICEFVYSLDNLMFVIDEVDWCCPNQIIPDFFGKIIRYGRHKQIDLIVSTRRPADLPRLITSQADCLYLFSIVEPRDIQYLDQFIAHLSIGQKIGSLKQFNYITYDVSEDKLSSDRTKI